ncbi:MAG: ABC transporter permease [Jatrophihabitantaceae bacterium]
MNDAVAADVRLGIGLAVLLVIAFAVLTVAEIPHRRGVLIAAVRAVVQLAVVALALRGVFAAPIAVIAVVTLMFSVATWTAGRRLRAHADAWRSVVLSCFAGAAVTIAIIVGMPTLSRDVRTLVAVSGIVLGGTMTAATLTGRRLLDGLHSRRDEVEAWLSIGATTRQAVRPIAKDAVFEALVPVLDQTRTVGLVTLPGAFVGALLGGASAAQAARFQIVVLVGLVCAQAITAVVLAYLLGAPAALPEVVTPRPR